MTTVTPEQRIAEPLHYESPPVDILDAAAQIIETNGRHVGNYYDALLELDTGRRSQWRPGTPCCTAGAIGIAIGLRRIWDIESLVVPAVGSAVFDDEPPHPAIAALMAHLDARDVNTVFAWSDEHEAPEIAAAMRECSAKLRAEAAA